MSSSSPPPVLVISAPVLLSYPHLYGSLSVVRTGQDMEEVRMGEAQVSQPVLDRAGREGQKQL